MPALTPEGEASLAAIASRHGVSVEAARVMLDALIVGGGGMAQFSHPEFGGSGQWMSGGMTMIGDMFNNALKARVDGLAYDLAGLMGAGGLFMPARQQPSQWQHQGQGGGGMMAGQSGGWWPADLGWPASSGAQNDMRYAYFPDTRRLALSRGGHVEVFDTGEHMIGGFGQQQGGGDSLTFTSQFGTVPIASLRRVDAAPSREAPGAAADVAWQDQGAAEPVPQAPMPYAAMPDAPAHYAPSAPAQAANAPADAATILSLLEKLGDLRDKGVLTDEEFAAKKGELLRRL